MRVFLTAFVGLVTFISFVYAFGAKTITEKNNGARVTAAGLLALAILAGYLLILGIGCLVADFVFPHIPFINRFLDSLPDWEDEY